MTISNQEQLFNQLSEVDPNLSDYLQKNIASLNTQDDLQRLRSNGYPIRKFTSSKDLQPKRDIFETSVNALLREIVSTAPSMNYELFETLTNSAVEVSDCVFDLLLNPPRNIDPCTRNPKKEYPQLIKKLFESKLTGEKVSIVVPTCADYLGYQLNDGIGEIAYKALDAIVTTQEFFDKQGFSTYFELHLADVEGLDTGILSRAGETQESHFAKTAETRNKIEQEARQREIDFLQVKSMHQQFIDKNIDYLTLQSELTEEIGCSDSRKIRRGVDQLIEERNRLGDFAEVPPEEQKSLARRELAGYAAYGHLINGESIILSPAALSAVPAYHFGSQANHKFTPVFYAK